MEPGEIGGLILRPLVLDWNDRLRTRAAITWHLVRIADDLADAFGIHIDRRHSHLAGDGNTEPSGST